MKRTKFSKPKPKKLVRVISAEPSTPNSAAPAGQVKVKAKIIKLTHYTLFRENKTSQAFTLPLEEIRERYQKHLKVYPKSKTVVAFVTSKKGLNSSMEVTQFNSLEYALKSK